MHGADHTLAGAVVTDRLASRLDVGRQRRLADEPITPDLVEGLFLADDLVPVLDQADEQIENLWLDPLDPCQRAVALSAATAS